MKVLSLCSLTGLEPSVMKFDGLLVIHKNYNTAGPSGSKSKVLRFWLLVFLL